MPQYVFDPDVVHEGALRAVGVARPAMFDVFADALAARYPGVLDRSQPWLYTIAGGAMLQMKLYFASLDEYVMIWGTPVGTAGHSGRHRVGFWDTLLDGEAWYFVEGEFEKRVYHAGDRLYLAPGQAVGMTFQANVWAVEYARGPIPLCLPFGLADVLLSTLDFKSGAQTVSLYADLAAQHFARQLARTQGPLAPLARHATAAIRDAARRVTQRLQPPAFSNDAPRDVARPAPVPPSSHAAE